MKLLKHQVEENKRERAAFLKAKKDGFKNGYCGGTWRILDGKRDYIVMSLSPTIRR
jgi:hypothetical protein